MPSCNTVVCMESVSAQAHAVDVALHWVTYCAGMRFKQTTRLGSPQNSPHVLPDTCRQRERIFFNSRKGIVAIAIRSGADIVPTYFLGQSQVRPTLMP